MMCCKVGCEMYRVVESRRCRGRYSNYLICPEKDLHLPECALIMPVMNVFSLLEFRPQGELFKSPQMSEYM
jgi:hypothetical protein